MNATYATPVKTRITAAFLAIVMSFAVLGVTVTSMQPGYDGAAPQLVALDRVIITAPAVN